jgi:hypothetical protein
MSKLTNNLIIDRICGNCGAWESDPFGKGWIGNCPFDQVSYTFTKKCEVDRWVPKYDGKAIKSYHKYADQMFVQGVSVSQNLALAHMNSSKVVNSKIRNSDRPVPIFIMLT